MSGPGTVSGDAGDEIAQDLEMQVERLTALHRGMQAHFESMDSENQAWKVWVFVFCLNVVAIGGAFYLKSIGIDLYAFRGTS